MIMIVTMAVQQVELYNSLSTVFLFVGFFFLLLAVVMFFAFHVANILAVKTGHAKRRSIKEMESMNTDAGRSQYLMRKKTIKDNKAVKRMWNTARLNGLSQDMDAGGIGELGNDDTTVLDAGSRETTTLNAYTAGRDDFVPWSEDLSVRIGKFMIVREIVMIHTEEVV